MLAHMAFRAVVQPMSWLMKPVPRSLTLPPMVRSLRASHMIFASVFDTVPVTLALQIMRQRGADNHVLRAMEGFYGAHIKHFRLEGAYSKSFTPHNGIVQGCPLSMMVLVSLITNWLEYVQSHVPEATPRSYADDLSVCAQHATSGVVKQRLRQVHQHTDRFVQLSGMVWHRDKSFIFGPRMVSRRRSCYQKLQYKLSFGWRQCQAQRSRSLDSVGKRPM